MNKKKSIEEINKTLKKLEFMDWYEIDCEILIMISGFYYWRN